MNKIAKRVLIGSGVTAAALVLAESARQGAANYMVRVALDRKIPPHPMRAERRIAASCGNQELLLQLRRAGKRLAAQPHKVIRAKSRDGLCLLGHWFPVPNPKRIIIAFHGWRSAWDNDFGIVAEFFRKNDCSALYVEQRGQGGSDGDSIGFGLTERHDCLNWINWVNEKTGGQIPIYLCGVSMGASTVLMATGLQLPENVRGVVADCGFTSPVDIWKHVAKRAHLSYKICGGAIGKIAKRRLRIGMDAVSCPQALAESKIPVLFVHGTDDHLVPIEMTYANFKACAAPKRLFIVPGAEHGMSYLVDPAGYEAAIHAFWNEFDKK